MSGSNFRWVRVACPAKRWTRLCAVENETGEIQVVTIAVDAASGTDLHVRLTRPGACFERTVSRHTRQLLDFEQLGFGLNLPRWSLYLRASTAAGVQVKDVTREGLRLVFAGEGTPNGRAAT